MEFDIVNYTEEEIKNLSVIQMQLLRSAQKRKNELYHKLEQDFAMFKKLAYTEGMHDSSLIEDKLAELTAEYEYQVEIIREQLLYAIELNAPIPNQSEEEANAGYIVDYSLSYTDRYVLVRDYYLAIEDPAERMALYSADDVAKRYLDSYYATLYNVLNMYSK